MKFIKIKFPSGSFGIQSQDPLTEDQADKLIQALTIILKGVF